LPTSLLRGEGSIDLRQDLTDAYSKLTQWQVINTTTLACDRCAHRQEMPAMLSSNDKLNSAIFGTAFSTPPVRR